MLTFLSAINFIFAICFLIGLIKPAPFNFIFSGRASRIKTSLTFFLAFIIVGVFSTFFEESGALESDIKSMAKTDNQEEVEPDHPDDQEINQTRDYSDMAYLKAQHFVEDSLLAPATADFPWLDYTSYLVEGKPNHYTVIGYVDTENLYGAKVRLKFACDLKFNGGDDADTGNWELLYMIFY